MLAGFATSMEKILPRHMSFELTVAKKIEVSLARNEKESFQVAVFPVGDGLKQTPRTDPVGTETILRPGRDLALHQDAIRDAAEEDAGHPEHQQDAEAELVFEDVDSDPIEHC